MSTNFNYKIVKSQLVCIVSGLFRLCILICVVYNIMYVTILIEKIENVHFIIL